MALLPRFRAFLCDVVTSHLVLMVKGIKASTVVKQMFIALQLGTEPSPETMLEFKAWLLLCTFPSENYFSSGVRESRV